MELPLVKNGGKGMFRGAVSRSSSQPVLIVFTVFFWLVQLSKRPALVRLELARLCARRQDSNSSGLFPVLEEIWIYFKTGLATCN